MANKKIKSCKKSTNVRAKQGMNASEWDAFMKTVESVKTEADEKLKEISQICLKRA